MIEIEYANAYTEVLEILKSIPQEELDKIPKSKIEFFERLHNEKYVFHYNVNKTLEEQKVSEKTKIIIAILFRDYWATDVQREKILLKEKYDTHIMEKKINEKYNQENIFNNTQAMNENEDKQCTEIIKLEKIKWYKRLFLILLKKLRR